MLMSCILLPKQYTIKISILYIYIQYVYSMELGHGTSVAEVYRSHSRAQKITDCDILTLNMKYDVFKFILTCSITF